MQIERMKLGPQPAARVYLVAIDKVRTVHIR
jgi:hypothetical protein